VQAGCRMFGQEKLTPKLEDGGFMSSFLETIKNNLCKGG